MSEDDLGGVFHEIRDENFVARKYKGDSLEVLEGLKA